MFYAWFCHYDGFDMYVAQYVTWQSGNQICHWMVPNTQTNDWDG